MDDGVRSDDPLSGVVRKRNSSGCLIIKKKIDRVGGGFEGSGSKTVFEARKEKKRSRFIRSDLGSAEELLEPVVRRNVDDNYGNGSVSHKGYGEDGRSSSGFESERKRSGLDVFDFDEYDDGFDGKKMRRDYVDDRLNLVGSSGSSGSRNVLVGRKKDIYYETRISLSARKSRYGLDEDESGLPIMFLKKHREAPDDAIRLQGKNGVLKVMVNKKKKPSFPDKNYVYQEAEERKGSRSEIVVKKNEVIRSPFYSDSKRTEKPVTFARKKQKCDVKLQKPLPVVKSKAEDSKTDDSETSLKRESTSEQADRSKKVIKNKSKRTLPPEITTPLGDKDGKVKRGSGTEKQLLREKIRSMLIDRGWTIDYRPRKNRDYLDAVYINPAGTAFWSIIKAYDALQKQLDEDTDKIKSSGDSTLFTPLADEILSKLTRQTRKKIEREMKRKRRDDECSKSAKEVTREVSIEKTVDETYSEQCDDKLSFYMKQNHKSLRGRLHEVDHASGSDPMLKQDRGENTSATNSHMIQGRKSRKIGSCTLFVRSSDNGPNSENDDFVPCSGKRTILSWLIDSKIVQLSEKVQYMNRRKTKVLLEGWITNEGIHCGCCSKILTISKFEIHAGSKQRQPFPNIFLESGLSLMQCQIDAWNKQNELARQGFQSVDVGGDDPNDDTCGICGDGGNLICCDGCPSTFHQRCLDIQMLPAGDWHCPNCTCKFCGSAGQYNAEANDGANSSLLLCSLCNKKYHQSCCQEMEDLSVDLLGDATDSFCGKKCQEVFVHLQKLLGVKHELEAGFSWSLVHRMDLASDASHLGFSQRVECNSKLAVALSVMDECFIPIVDRKSGVNLIHNVLYNCGSNFSRLNYSGFYTAILERGDEIVSVASIRIHGTQLAEMPFIGTRHMYRRQGMCRRLLCAIESALSSLKVEKLIIPAIAEHMHTWTTIFNFGPLEESHKQEMKSMNMLVFPGTDMLQKLLLKLETKTENITADSDTTSTEAKENHLLFPALDVKSELDSSPECDFHMTDEAGLPSLNVKTNEALATSSAEQARDNPSNDTSAVVPLNDITVNSELDHMTSDCELHSLNVIKNEACAQAQNYPLNDTSAVVPSNDIAVISCSFDYSCEPKLETPINDAAIAIDSEVVNKIAESIVVLKSVGLSDPSPIIVDTEKSVLDSPVKHQPSLDDVQDDALIENVEDSCIGLAHDSLGDTTICCTEEAITVQNSVSAHSAYERATDSGNTCNADVDDSLVEPVDSVEQSFAINKVNAISLTVESNIKSRLGVGVAHSHEVNKVDEKVNENVAPVETSIQFDRVNVVEDSHEIDEKVNENAARVDTVILSNGGNLAGDCFYEQDEELTENTVPVEASIHSDGGSVDSNSREDEKDEKVNENAATIESSIQSSGGNVAFDVLQELDEKINEYTAPVEYGIQSNEGTAPGDSNELNEKDEKVNQNAIPVETSIQSNGGTVTGDSHEVNENNEKVKENNEKVNENAEAVECSIQSNGGTVPGDCNEVNEKDENTTPVEASIQSNGDTVAGDSHEVNENATPVETCIQSNRSNVTGDSHEGKDKDEKVNESAAAVETGIQADGGNVARDSHVVSEKEKKVDCVQQLALDSFVEILGKKITDSRITQAESSCGKDGIGEEANGGTINQGDERSDAPAPKVDVEVAFVEPVLDSSSKTLAQNCTQVLSGNLTVPCSVLDESTIHESVSGHQRAVDMDRKSHG